MKKYIGFLILSVALLNLSCDKCNEGNLVEPAAIFVEVVDAVTLENVFVNEDFTPQQIAIKDLEDKLIPYNFVTNSNLIRIFPNTKNEIGNTFIITLNNETTSIIKEITILHDVEANPQECYTSYKIKNVQVPNQESEIIDGIYIIKI